jgi:stearoyl-CoA desaturase (delta-9 desaturase)
MFSATAQTITKVQIVTGLTSLLGLFYFDFTLTNILILIVSFYMYSIIGVSLTLHRYYSHKSFEFKYDWIKWLCTLIAILSGRGSPIGWVYVHRIHHAYSDTNKDPHSPKNLGFKLFGFKHIEEHSSKMNFFLVKDLMNPIQLKINEYYFLIILIFAVMMSLVDVSLLYFVWVLPVFLIQLSQNSFNYFAHTYGHRNVDTRDSSTNNMWLWPFILGDAWHNNHHANAAKLSTKVRWYEFDPVVFLIKLIKHK